MTPAWNNNPLFGGGGGLYLGEPGRGVVVPPTVLAGPKGGGCYFFFIFWTNSRWISPFTILALLQYGSKAGCNYSLWPPGPALVFGSPRIPRDLLFLLCFSPSSFILLWCFFPYFSSVFFCYDNAGIVSAIPLFESSCSYFFPPPAPRPPPDVCSLVTSLFFSFFSFVFLLLRFLRLLLFLFCGFYVDAVVVASMESIQFRQTGIGEEHCREALLVQYDCRAGKICYRGTPDILGV